MALHRAIIDLDEFTESKNVMIYADTGAGKTMLTAGLDGKVLIISSENGTIVIKKWLAKYGKPNDSKRFKMWPIKAWKDLEEAYTWCRDNPGVFDWIVIDSATSLEQRAMRAAMEVAVARNPTKRDIDLPDVGEHQKRINAMKRMISDFNELPTDVLWYAQAMYRVSRDGDEIVLPFIMGKDYDISAWACAQMQAFGYYRKVPETKDGVTVTRRELLFDSYVDGKGGVEYWAKDRYGVLPRKATIAIGDEQKGTLGKLFALIEQDPTAVKRATAEVAEIPDTEQEMRDGEQEQRDDEAIINGGSFADEAGEDPPQAAPRKATARPSGVSSRTPVAARPAARQVPRTNPTRRR